MFKHLIRRYLSLALVLALVLAASVGTVQTAVASGENGIARAIAAQEKHTDELFGINGVVGTAVGLGGNGRAVVFVLTERASVRGIPGKLDGVTVVPQITGKIAPLHHQPDHCGGPPSRRPVECNNGSDNAAPVADDQSVTTLEDADVTITLMGSDADGCGATFTFNITESPTGGSLGNIGGVTCDGGNLATDVTYDPDPTTTDDSFTFTISDETATSNTATVSITVGSTITFLRPAPIGTSSGPDELITDGIDNFCIGGTLGARVSSGVGVFALSNAHVYAREGSTPAPGEPVSDGDLILQPGRIDLPTPNCGTGAERTDAQIGNLAAWVPLTFGNTTSCTRDDTATCNRVDAAIAALDDDAVGVSTPGDGYGTPISATIVPAVGLKVQKYGRTTGLTTGRIWAINAILNIEYDTGVARFVGQMIVRGGGFSLGGDSGSLVVINKGSNDRMPVGLLFAGSNNTTIINPIDAVLTELSALSGVGTLMIDGE